MSRPYTPEWKARAKKIDVTPAQLDALDAMYTYGERWIMDFAIPRASIRKLEAKKLVKIRPSKDGAGRPNFGYVSITKAGEKALLRSKET